MSGLGEPTVPKAPMTSVTGNSRSARVSAGFTLIEIVLVLGLIAFAGSIVIANFATMAERGDVQTSEEIVHAAIRKARFLAASERVLTSLHFDKESGSLQISGDLSAPESLPLDASFGQDGRAEIRFYLVPPATGLAPHADAVRTRLETQTVQFAADRSSNPFVVEIDPGSGTPQRLVFDPFSSLRLSTEQ
jgi:type II secretory pathway pseudopilin PulG